MINRERERRERDLFELRAFTNGRNSEVSIGTVNQLYFTSIIPPSSSFSGEEGGGSEPPGESVPEKEHYSVSGHAVYPQPISHFLCVSGPGSHLISHHY